MKYILFLALILGISSFTSNEKTVWNYLIRKGYSKAGTAGLMGNLKAESGVRSVIYENSKKSKIGLTDQQYVDQVNSGAYSEYKFVHDAAGFGLAQWTYYTRKQALYNKCHGKIGDMNCQLDYLVMELANYYGSLNSFLKSSGSVRDCAVKVLKEFERPADQGTSVQNKRTQYAQEYYNGFAGGANPTPDPDPTPSGKTYTVQRGDTLSGIARKFGTTVTVLAQLNNIKDVNKIYVGQVLRLP
jgi:LysM repeat protein